MQTYWNPWSIFDELDRSIFGAVSSPRWPQFDIEDTDDATVLIADMPGMTEDDVEVTVRAPYLIVRGERKPPSGQRARLARRYGSFERQFWIGNDHDLERIEAHLANGELVVRIAKTAAAKPRRIKLGTGIAAKVKGLLTADKDKTAA